MKKFTKEIKIALVVIAGLIILFFGMNYLKGLDIFSSSNKYFISFKIQLSFSNQEGFLEEN